MRKIITGSIVLIILLTLGCKKNYLDPVPKTSLSDLSRRPGKWYVRIYEKWRLPRG
jgi:hypothetical protein